MTEATTKERVLLAIAENGPATNDELQAILGLSGGTINRWLRSIRKDGNLLDEKIKTGPSTYTRMYSYKESWESEPEGPPVREEPVGRPRKMNPVSASRAEEPSPSSNGHGRVVHLVSIEGAWLSYGNRVVVFRDHSEARDALRYLEPIAAGLGCVAAVKKDDLRGRAKEQGLLPPEEWDA